MKKYIVITGGAGFIGSNLAWKIVDLGGEVTIIDSLVPEYGGMATPISKNFFYIATTENFHINPH